MQLRVGYDTRKGSPGQSEVSRRKKLIDKKGKDPGEFILKVNKKARNFSRHDIKPFPDSSDAISLPGDTSAILRTIMELEESSKS